MRGGEKKEKKLVTSLGRREGKERKYDKVPPVYFRVYISVCVYCEMRVMTEGHDGRENGRWWRIASEASELIVISGGTAVWRKSR